MIKNNLLANYPHLLQALQKNPEANKEFNECLSSLDSFSNFESLLDKEREEKEKVREELIAALKEEETRSGKLAKIGRFIELLGGVIEPQVDLQPYTQDKQNKSTYTIEFSYGQIRWVLALYWELIAQAMETHMKSIDPAEERVLLDSAEK